MPDVTGEEDRIARRFLRQFGIETHIQMRLFRLLYPGYLLGAFEQDAGPFDPANWSEWKDHGRFIPID